MNIDHAIIDDSIFWYLADQAINVLEEEVVELLFEKPKMVRWYVEETRENLRR